MKKLKVVLVLVLILVVAAIGVLFASGNLGPSSSDATGSSAYETASAPNASSIKAQINDALHENAGVIAKQTGAPEFLVNGMIDSLNIESWDAVVLPGDVVAMGTRSINYGGYDAELTTYDDPGVVTVTTDLGTVTLAVPEGAQGYLQYLK